MITKTHVFRIKPGKDVFKGVFDYCNENKITSGVVLSLLGSLNNIELGFLKELPGKFITKKFEGPLEIACGTGTIAQKDGESILHIHIVISNENGAFGGHLVAGDIFSTAEVVIGELDEEIKREKDDFTGLNEIV